jgi:hypothetical protein
VVVNERLWRVRAPSLAKEALEAYFGGRLARASADGSTRTAAAR